MDPTTARLWAKAYGTDGVFHPLINHMVDVGTTAEAILQRAMPRALRERFERLGGVESLSAWCALHDLGKASPAFQAKRPDLAARVEQAGLPVGKPLVPQKAPHGLVTLWTLPALLRERGASAVGAGRIAEVLGAHHGLFAAPAQQLTQLWKLAGTGGWTQCRNELVDAVLRSFGADVPGSTLDFADAVLLAGLCSVADWIGSNTTWFPYSTDVDPGHYLVTARQQANQALDELYWTPSPACLPAIPSGPR